MTTVKGQDWKNFLNIALKEADSDPKNRLTDARKIIIENQVNECFHRMRNFHDHPTYAWMILNAISKLNEETGSSEEAISEFIKKEFNNLPWFHVTYLEKQLRTLCENGEISITHENLYMISKGAGASLNLDHSLSLKQPPRKCQYGKRDHTPKNTRGKKKPKKTVKDQEMDTLEVEKIQPTSLILRFRVANSTSSSHPKPKTQEYDELVVVSHPKLEKEKGHSELVQLDRGQRNNGKMAKSVLISDQKQAENSTPRPNGRPPRYKPLADKKEALQLGGKTEHTLMLPPQRSDKNTPTDRSKKSLPISRSTEPNMANGIPKGIIIALPAQVRQPVNQKAQRDSSSKMWEMQYGRRM